ncbi:YihY/virulence factor BrkB family protein [Halanaerobium hydrogeniformans]|uniref:Ribonuclease BN n=1 Tax=Halanaerobium hydrogeniformans TaxID=656519 RepID=E4RK83_HALHG|nr:YhjD/YihY/BrkB family envelope integrity protein [Halanaerobium hydrogeniformans]ADQ14635.1 ribonuclease BN [Halanaerobium hydrogeniformans]
MTKEKNFLNKIKNNLKNIQLSPAKWKMFIIRVYQKSRENDILIQAMGMAYISILTIVPFLIFSFYIMTLFNFFGRLDTIVEQIKNVILNNLAAGTGETLINYLEIYIFNVDIEQLGAVSFLSLIILIVFMLARVEVTFNQIWSVREHRDIVKRFVAFWTFITLGTFLITLLLTATLVLAEQYLGLGMPGSRISESNIFNWILFSFNFLVFIIAYYFIPNRDVDPLAATFAGLISGGLFILSKNIYTIYTRNLVVHSYERQIYGSLYVIPFFLVWLYLIWLIVLIGAVISYVFHYRNDLEYLKEGQENKKGFKALIPAAVLIALQKDFLKKDSNGLEFKDLINKIKLPTEKIKEVLKEMQSKNLITETKEGNYTLLTDVSSLSLWEIYDSPTLKAEIDIKEVFLDPEMEAFYDHLSQNLNKSLREVKIKDLLTKKK